MFPFPSVSAQLQAAPHAKGNKTPEVCPSLVPTGEIEGDDELRSLFLKLPAKKKLGKHTMYFQRAYKKRIKQK